MSINANKITSLKSSISICTRLITNKLGFLFYLIFYKRNNLSIIIFINVNETKLIKFLFPILFRKKFILNIIFETFQILVKIYNIQSIHLFEVRLCPYDFSLVCGGSHCGRVQI